MSLSADGFLVRIGIRMFALVLGSGDEGVRAIQGGFELVLVEQGNVRFDTGALVVLVVNELDSLKISRHDVRILSLCNVREKLGLTEG